MAEKARIIRNLITVFETEPLSDETWDFWYKTDAARETEAIQSIITILETVPDKPKPIKILFCGHRGCGKSTELNRVRTKLKDMYSVDSSSVLKRYPLHAVDHRLILFYCAERLIEMAEKANVGLTKDEKSVVLEWFDKKSITHVENQGHDVSVETGAGINILKLITASVSGKIYSGGKTQDETLKYILDRVDRYILGLKIINNKIREKTGKPPLLILEDLDKISELNQSKKIFIENSKIMIDLPFHAIFTFPISLYYDPKSNLQNYDHREILPMIPIDDQPREIAKETRKGERGRDCLRKIFSRRVENPEQLIEGSSLNLLIEKCGGVLKDFTYLIRESAVFALNRNSGKIEDNDVNNAIRKLQNEYENYLGEYGEGDEKITVKAILDIIDLFQNGPLISVDHTGVFKHLLQNLCILEYNGERWYDLHPLIRDSMKRKKWRETQ